MAQRPPEPARVTSAASTAALVARAARLSPRGLSYLLECAPGLAPAAAPGTWRRYSAADVARIAVAARLLRFGFPPATLGVMLDADLPGPVVYLSRSRDGVGRDVLVNPDPAALKQGAVLRLDVAAIVADATKRLTAARSLTPRGAAVTGQARPQPPHIDRHWRPKKETANDPS